MNLKAVKKSYNVDFYRILTIGILGIFLYTYYSVREKFQSVCYPDLNPEYCTDVFRSYIHSPLTNSYNEILILLFLLFLLPTQLLRNWFLYIGSWAVPLSLWFVSITADTPQQITWVNSPSNAALLSVNLLIWVTIAYAGVYLAWHVWRRKTHAKTE